MVDSVTPLARAITLLRQSVTATSAAANIQAAQLQPTRSKTPAAKSHTPERSHVASLHSRLAALRMDDPLRARKSLRLFIEAVFLDQFGGDLILAPDFQDLVDRSLSAMEANTELRELLDRAISELAPRPD
jgi:hypothetical protein